MSQNCSVTITINRISDKKASAVKKSLEPDNVNFPDGLSMKVEKIDNKLVFSFSNSGNMGKLISTIDEVLEHTNLALGVMK
jgi:hypothetical protein